MPIPRLSTDRSRSCSPRSRPRQLDVLTVPLGALASAYLEAMGGLAGDRLPYLSAFVAVAAQLILIKSRALLPREPAGEPAALAVEGPIPRPSCAGGWSCTGPTAMLAPGSAIGRSPTGPSSGVNRRSRRPPAWRVPVLPSSHRSTPGRWQPRCGAWPGWRPLPSRLRARAAHDHARRARRGDPSGDPPRAGGGAPGAHRQRRRPRGGGRHVPGHAGAGQAARDRGRAGPPVGADPVPQPRGRGCTWGATSAPIDETLEDFA